MERKLLSWSDTYLPYIPRDILRIIIGYLPPTVWAAQRQLVKLRPLGINPDLQNISPTQLFLATTNGQYHIGSLDQDVTQWRQVNAPQFYHQYICSQILSNSLWNMGETHYPITTLRQFDLWTGHLLREINLDITGAPGPFSSFRVWEDLIELHWGSHSLRYQLDGTSLRHPKSKRRICSVLSPTSPAKKVSLILTSQGLEISSPDKPNKLIHNPDNLLRFNYAASLYFHPRTGDLFYYQDHFVYWLEEKPSHYQLHPLLFLDSTLGSIVRLCITSSDQFYLILQNETRDTTWCQWD